MSAYAGTSCSTCACRPRVGAHSSRRESKSMKHLLVSILDASGSIAAILIVLLSAMVGGMWGTTMGDGSGSLVLLGGGVGVAIGLFVAAPIFGT
jgi:hypothetical protein